VNPYHFLKKHHNHCTLVLTSDITIQKHHTVLPYSKIERLQATPSPLPPLPRIREHIGSVIGGRVPAAQGSSGPCVYCRKPGVRSLYTYVAS